VWFRQAMHCRNTILDLEYKTQTCVSLSFTFQALYTTLIAVTNMTSYEVLRELGEGGFGLVVLARLKATENVSITSPSDTDLYANFPAQLVAVKNIAFKGHRSVLELSRLEIRVLRRLNHVHVVRFIDYELSPENATIIMEYCAKGDLRSLIDDAISDR